MTKLRLEGIDKKWDGFHAVKNLDLQIDDREFLVLLGPSGCGKTTTMRMIAGLEQPSSGLLYFDAEAVNGMPPRRRDVAMVFQNYGLYPHMSVRDNIGYPLRLRGQSAADIERAIARAAARVELQHLLDRRPAELSGGQRQRVALARSIVRKPRVFLMDEPLSNLDAKLRGTMRAELRHLARELEVTTVYVTHDQVEAMTLATRVAVMKEGVLQQIDTPENIYNKPANSFVASFIGSPAMNLIKGQAQDGRFMAEGGHAIGIRPPRSGALVLGVRPEDIALHDGAAPATLSGEVYAFELLGDNTLLTLKLDGQYFVAKMEKSTRFREGERIHLWLKPERVYWFDARSGVRIDQ